MPTSIVPASIWKFGWPTAGRVQGPRPTPIERQLSIAFWAVARTSSRLAPSFALAPPIFHMKISPATPRRFSRSSGGAEQTSSLATTTATSMPSFDANFCAIFTFMLSPA
ncbi:hypothetical protein ASF65_14715 [Aureimonas sp. Leaf324]|nr:hypothetical protein ASF65_14715 [Aureimonas sp. Leaf324]